jgi:heme/copper-type cytochrome/quinol oxidase subunit 2
VLCALVLSGAAFAGEPGFTPVEPASPNAEGINESYLWIAIFTGAIFVLVQGTLVWFIVRYRADRRSREMDGAQVHGNTNIELAWSGAPGRVRVAIGSVIL